MRPLDLGPVARTERTQEGEVEPGQPVLVFYHHLPNLFLFYQFKELVEFGAGVTHP
jgi:hypothetical protein